MVQCLGKTVKTGGSSVYGGRLIVKEPKLCRQETVPDPWTTVPDSDST